MSACASATRSRAPSPATSAAAAPTKRSSMRPAMSSPHAEAAAQAPEALPPWPEGALQVVGQPVERASARAKVTGAAEYASDVVRPGLLHAVLLRSTVARGRMTRFDAAHA